MNPVIERDVAQKLLDRALSNQGDPMGYRAFGGTWDGQEDDVDGTTEADQVNLVDELAGDALAGREGACSHIVRHTRTARHMDAITAAVLLHMGIEPAGALAMLEAVLATGERRMQIADADADDTHWVVDANAGLWRVKLDAADGPGAMWISNGELVIAELPETIMAAAAGRPLRDIVSHPALDALPLTVAYAASAGGETALTIAGTIRGSMEGFTDGDLGSSSLADLNQQRLARARSAKIA